jgi:hypothetical protein
MRRTILPLSFGWTVSAWPVHASNAFRCATIQSNLPSRCTTVNEVKGFFVDRRAVMGDVDDIWVS